MEFRTVVDVAQAEWRIEPFERLLLVGSCFAQNMGLKFEDAQFPTVVNPFGVMYNPVSILHTATTASMRPTCSIPLSRPSITSGSGLSRPISPPVRSNG